MFVGRRRELELLGRQYNRTEGAFVPVYGRRRIGKSELLRQFLRSRPGIYFVGKSAPRELQLREFAREAARLLDERLLESLGPRGDWKSLLQEVTDRWRGPGKLVLAFDEFQWTAESCPELTSVLQELWDRQWRSAGVMLILCGSLIGFMEREVLGRKSPLFGRRTAEIRLRPFEPQEAAEFHPRWSRTDQASAYFFCGGVAQYHRALDPELSIRQNLQATILSEFAPLFREPDFLLREELRDLEKYHAVLASVASGANTLAAIASRTQVPRGSVHYYTETLNELGYITKSYPLSRLGGRPPTRSVRFVLGDALLRFWFRFIFPNQSAILRHGPRDAYRHYVAPELDAYFGYCFELLCRQQLPAIYQSEGVNGRFEVGEFWNKQVQIDVVGIRDDGRTDLGECKWGTVRSAAALERLLARKLAAFPNPSGHTLHSRLFVRNRPRGLRSAPGTSWHDLRDLYSAPTAG